ncbi:lytic murein transglycosylase [Patescibacteria group bacterium AH-259-L05]|nr:lytic murein transglycosylase [Patescibacteria group bacterium AH-259-L05]
MRFFSTVVIYIACFGTIFAQDDTTASDQLIKIHTRARILEFFENDSLVFTFPIRVGKEDTPTPLGTAYVYIKRNPPIFHEIDPGTKERTILYEVECGDGTKRIDYKNIKALGLRYETAILDPQIARKLNLGKHPQRYSIYSVTCEETIGLTTSGGSVGLLIDDMLELYPRVKIGCPVIISDDLMFVYWQRHEYKKMYGKLFDDLEDRGYTRKELESIFSDPRITFYEYVYKELSKEEKKKINELAKGHGKKVEKATGGEIVSESFKLDFSESSIQRGRRFLAEYDSLLQSVEDIHGLDKEMNVSVLYQESNFGADTGDKGVLSVFNTYFLLHPKRSKRAWGRKELISFLTICKQNKWDPLAIKGAAAGEMGMPQFLPSSYVAYAVDGNSDGIVDLWNIADAAHSVANYLKQSGWRKGYWDRENRHAVGRYNKNPAYAWNRARYAKAIGWKPKEY